MTSTDYRRESYANWQRVASSWERRGEKMWLATEPVSRNLVERLQLQAGQTVLELAAGPGQTGLLAADAVGPEGRLISTDFAPAMVDAARRLTQELGVANAEHRVMDAEAIDLPDASVDAVLCRWGFMLFPDRARAFAETRRVLRPGGRLAFAVWAPADANPWASVVGRTVVAHGLMPPPEPDAPGMFSLAEPERIEAMVGAAGFETVEIDDVPIALAYDSFGDYWTTTLELGAGISNALAPLPEEEREQTRAAVERAAEPYRTADGYEFPGLSRNVLAS
jgi:ubiquinone/menaquinone biosynthesis C-methylase UbiE